MRSAVSTRSSHGRVSLTREAKGLDEKLLGLFVVTLLFGNGLFALSLVRSSGLPGLDASQVAQLSVLLARVLDALFLGAFLATWKKPLLVRNIDYVAVLVVTYPLLIGIARNEISVSTFSDMAMYAFFLAKVVALRTLLASLRARQATDAVLGRLFRLILRVTLLYAAIALAAGLALRSLGLLPRYQTPVDVTLALSIALNSQHLFSALMLVAFAVISAKRMFAVGAIAMVALYFLGSGGRLKAKLLGAGAVMLLLVTAAVQVLPENSPWMARLQLTYIRVDTALGIGDSTANRVRALDPARFDEAQSLVAATQGIDWLVGHGYGYRYYVSSAGMRVTERNKEVSDSHFTPLGIISAFGIPGLVFWIVYVAPGLGPLLRQRRSSRTTRVGALALTGMLIQSLFAYGFFISSDASFSYALATQGSKNRPSRRPGLGRAHGS